MGVGVEPLYSEFWYILGFSTLMPLVHFVQGNTFIAGIILTGLSLAVCVFVVVAWSASLMCSSLVDHSLRMSESQLMAKICGAEMCYIDSELFPVIHELLI